MNFWMNETWGSDKGWSLHSFHEEQPPWNQWHSFMTLVDPVGAPFWPPFFRQAHHPPAAIGLNASSTAAPVSAKLPSADQDYLIWEVTASLSHPGEAHSQWWPTMWYKKLAVYQVRDKPVLPFILQRPLCVRPWIDFTWNNILACPFPFPLLFPSLLRVLFLRALPQ